MNSAWRKGGLMDGRRRPARVAISIGFSDAAYAAARGNERLAFSYAIDVEDALGSVYEHGEATFTLPGADRPKIPGRWNAIAACGEVSPGMFGLFTLRRAGAAPTMRMGVRAPAGLNFGDLRRGSGDDAAAGGRGGWPAPGPEVFSATFSLKGETVLILAAPMDKAGLNDARASDAFCLRMRVHRAGRDDSRLSFVSDLTDLPHGPRLDILTAGLGLAFHDPAHTAPAPSA